MRTQRYRLDGEGQLFDMVNDPGQQNPVNTALPDVANDLQQKADHWLKTVAAGTGVERPFLICHPDAQMTQIPARDGRNKGGIERSTKYPNDSYFTNWTSVDGRINWECIVGRSGTYKVELFYTCPASDIGSTVELSFNGNKLVGKITEPHDPPLVGMERDRVKRRESYTKDFKRMTLGEIQLEEGSGTLTLRAISIPGRQVMDLRTLLLTRL